MQEVIEEVDSIKFDIEIALEQQLGAMLLPFPGMDKAGAAVCNFYMRNNCNKGTACPFRHVRGDRTVVCKHWLRGLCKKGDDCEFLHEYDMSKMPECYFFSRFGQCSNKDCPFLHIDPQNKIKDCAWYDRGFCRHGPLCKNKHVRRILCINFLCGFCLDGPKCQFKHPKFELPDSDANQKGNKTTRCNFCNELGHKYSSCPKLFVSKTGTSIATSTVENGISVSPSKTSNTEVHSSTIIPHKPIISSMHEHMRQPLDCAKLINPGEAVIRRPLEEVTCFKCGELGHYANKCPKGHLAFLSHPQALSKTSTNHTEITQPS